jgi:hypothetical protein
MNHPEKSPRTAKEQDAPEPERPVTPLEEEGMDIQQLDDPPQAEGPRGRETDRE